MNIATCAPLASIHNQISTYLLLESEDLEALKVGQVLPALSALGLLGKVALRPLVVDLVLLPELLNGTGAGCERQLGDDEVSQGSMCEREDMTRDDLLLVAGRTVNEDLQLYPVNFNCPNHITTSPTPSVSSFSPSACL